MQNTRHLSPASESVTPWKDSHADNRRWETHGSSAAVRVVSSLSSTEVHLWKGVKGALVCPDEHLLKERLVVDCVVASLLASRGEASLSTASREEEVGVLSLLERDVSRGLGRLPETETVDLSEVLVDGGVSLETKDTTGLEWII